MVSLQKLYSKFKAIESGRAVTEVTKGSCCGRRDRWRQLSAIRGTETCSTRLKVFFRLRPVPVAHTQRGGALAAGRDRPGYSPAADGFHGLFRHARAKAG